MGKNDVLEVEEISENGEGPSQITLVLDPDIYATIVDVLFPDPASGRTGLMIDPRQPSGEDQLVEQARLITRMKVQLHLN